MRSATAAWFSRWLLVAVLAVSPALSQEPPARPESAVAGAAITLPEEVAAGFEQRLADIKAQQESLTQLRAMSTEVDGAWALILATRADLVWAATFDALVSLARDVLASSDEGFDVTRQIEALVSDIELFPDEAGEMIGRLRDGIVFPSDDLEPAQIAIQDQQLLLAVGKLDYVMHSMVTYLQVAEELGIEDTAGTDYLHSTLEESAANRSVFLQLALEKESVLEAARTALPDDAEVGARHAVAKERVEIASEILAEAVELMRELGLDTSEYSKQVLSTTRELTSEVLNVSLLGALIAEWSVMVKGFVETEAPKLLFRLLLVVLIIFVFIRLGRLAQRITRRGLNSPRVRMTALLREMIVATVMNLVFLLGILIALSQLGISLGPLLAGLGIAGFIIGFALQDTLANFASGMLILIYRPFDVGDYVTAGGVTGTVHNMSIVNTTFRTIDNQVLVVPNNLIWSDVITNVTAQKIRRVDLTFGVAYSDDVVKVEKILADIVASHELVLDDPEPMIKLHELDESSVNFVVRPWVRTDDYWDVYWDMTRAVKMRFDEEGITIPFPQREIHMAAKPE